MNDTLNNTCEYCGKEYEAKRKTSKYCSAECRRDFNRDRAREFDEKPIEEKLSVLETVLGFKIDRTKAFTPEQQEKVNKLPRHQWYAAMERPNSAETMSDEERLKHYKSSNYPELKTELAGPTSRKWGV